MTVLQLSSNMTSYPPHCPKIHQAPGYRNLHENISLTAPLSTNFTLTEITNSAAEPELPVTFFHLSHFQDCSGVGSDFFIRSEPRYEPTPMGSFMKAKRKALFL